MKKVLIVLLVSITTMLTGQFVENHAVYLSGGVVFGETAGISASLNYILKNKYSMELGGSALWRKSDFHPDDYIGGMENLVSLGLSAPRSKMFFTEFLIGRVLKLNKMGTIRLNCKVGVADVLKKEPTKWEKRKWDIWGGNYGYDYTKKRAIGFVFKPELEFPFYYLIGCSLSPYLVYDRERLYYGLQVKAMNGVLRSPNKKKSTSSTGF